MDRRTTRPAPRRPRPQRSLFAFLALFVTVAQLFGLAHLVLVSHAICEHGALPHAEIAPRADARAADADGKPSAVPGGAAAEHDHCDPFALKPATVSVEPACAVPELLDFALLDEAPPASFAFRPIGILALAPKSSPPLAAPFTS